MNLYDDRDTEALGDTYYDHVQHMTEEGLHSKSAIAAELAVRDLLISSLQAKQRLLEWLIKEKGCLLKPHYKDEEELELVGDEVDGFVFYNNLGEQVGQNNNLVRAMNVAYGEINKDATFKMIMADEDGGYDKSEFLEATKDYKEGQLLPTPDKVFIQACCDCGLTHRVEIESDLSGVRIFSEDELTRWTREKRDES